MFSLHPLCTFFPRLADDEFAALKADIAANGQTHPIYTLDGMVLDGGNRYRALTELGIEPRTIEYTGGNPAQFVLSSNLRRRHLTPGQAAAIVSAAQDWSRTHPPHRATEEGRSVAPLSTVADRTELSGASHRTQQMADKLVKEAPPELVKEVTEGKKSLPKALYEITPKPPKPAPEPKPPKPAESSGLEAENARLKEQVEAMQESMVTLSDDNLAMSEDIASYARVDEADDQIAAALAEAKRFREVNRVLEERIRGLMNEKNEYVRLTKSWKAKAERLEKRVAELEKQLDGMKEGF